MASKTEFLAAEGSAGDWEEAIRLCGKHIVEAGYADQRFVEECVAREREYPTGLPSDVPVAMPHCKSEGIKKNCVCFMKLDSPVEFRRMDDDSQTIKTRIVLNLALKSDDHLQFLQKLIGLVMDSETVGQCLSAPLEDVPALLAKEVAKE